MRVSVGINGFGRFGLHLLKFWLDRYQTSPFSVDYINDDTITVAKAYEFIKNDKYVDFGKYHVALGNDCLNISLPGEITIAIKFTNQPGAKIPWIGGVKLFLECTGKFTHNRDAEIFLKGETQHVVVSATLWNADKTLVYGFNHQDFTNEHKIVSYGSCTVNAYVPLANYLNQKFSIKDSDVNVIHNTPGYILKDPKNYTLIRKTCTLEKSAPNLLEFLSDNNFKVNYTLIPYDGISIIDFRFRLKEVVDLKEIIQSLESSIFQGSLTGLYNIDEVDRGPRPYVCSPYSAVLIRESIQLKEDNLYFMAYFDNENSVNRYYDLSSYIAQNPK